MLHSLSIRNYALIESLDIVFNDGFSIITGETGAGKSILLGALALVLGQRADTNVLKNKDDKCVIEASFKIAGYGMENLFETLDIEYDDASTIRRIISPNGKTRAFINETPVNLNDLKDIASRLVDIHSQHQNLILNDPEFQLRVVDIFAKNKSLVLNYSALYDNFKRVKNQLRSLTDEAEKAKAEYDFFTHNYNELHAANLQDDEQITLEAELEVLLHASGKYWLGLL